MPGRGSVLAQTGSATWSRSSSRTQMPFQAHAKAWRKVAGPEAPQVFQLPCVQEMAELSLLNYRSTDI